MTSDPNLAARLAEARRKAGFKSPREAAQAYNWNENTYKSREGGIRGVSLDNIQRYARAFNVSPFWLITGEGNQQEINRVSVVGQIVDKGLVYNHVAEREMIETGFDVDCLIPIPHMVIGYEIRDFCMYPRYDSGDIILVSTEAADLDKTIEGSELIVRPNGLQRVLAKFMNSGQSGLYDLESHNWPAVRDISIVDAYLVVGVVRFGQQKRPDQRNDFVKLIKAMRARDMDLKAD